MRTSEIETYNHTCEAKSTLMYNYKYCFPFNITLKMGTYRSPPYVFRLPRSEPFVILSKTYTPVIKKYNITNDKDLPAIDSVHLSHFPMGSEVINEARWSEKIQYLRTENEKLVQEQSNSISIVKNSGAWWAIISFIAILAILCVSLVAYNIHLSQKSSIRHRNMAKDIMELKSEYAEVKVDCVNCSNKTSNKKSSRDERQNIEVGKDESITINLNRPLPPPPVVIKSSNGKRDSL